MGKLLFNWKLNRESKIARKLSVCSSCLGNVQFKLFLVGDNVILYRRSSTCVWRNFFFNGLRRSHRLTTKFQSELILKYGDSKWRYSVATSVNGFKESWLTISKWWHGQLVLLGMLLMLLLPNSMVTCAITHTYMSSGIKYQNDFQPRQS